MTDAPTTIQIELAPNEIMLFGEKKQLQPLKGRKARLMVPRLIEFATRALGMLSQSDIDVWSLFSNFRDLDTDQETFDTVIRVFNFLAVGFRDKWEELEIELMPYLLQVEPEELEHEGELVEVIMALYRALKWYFDSSIDSAQKAGLTRALEGFAKNASPRVETE